MVGGPPRIPPTARGPFARGAGGTGETVPRCRQPLPESPGQGTQPRSTFSPTLWPRGPRPRPAREAPAGANEPGPSLRPRSAPRSPGAGLGGCGGRDWPARPAPQPLQAAAPARPPLPPRRWPGARREARGGASRMLIGRSRRGRGGGCEGAGPDGSALAFFSASASSLIASSCQWPQ